MKKLVKLCAMALALVMSMGIIAGCNPDNGGGGGGKLKITFFNGGYGTAWAYAIAEKYTQATGVEIEIDPSETITSDYSNFLENGTDSDIIMSHGIVWELYALQGMIEPLNDLYAMECDGGTVEDRVVTEILQDCKLKFNDTYYKLPWTNGAGGLVYNQVLFDKYGWEVPETYEDLVALCQTIEEAKIVVDPNLPEHQQRTIKPFAWSAEHYYWDYLVNDWWAQLQGIDGINAIKQLKNKEVFDPAGSYKFDDAVQLWVDLVAPHEVNGEMVDYSLEGSSGRQYQAAQIDFINGYAAMMPNAHWLESEMRDNIDPEKCILRLMPSPTVPGAKTDANGNVIRVNYQVGGGDSIIIPAKADNKEEAKKFLAFMLKEENAKLFTARSLGGMLGVKYTNLDGIEDKYLTPFARDIFEINKTSLKFNLYSQSNLVLNKKITIEWAEDGINEYATLYAGTNNVSDLFATKYASINENFASWKEDSDKVYGAE